MGPRLCTRTRGPAAEDKPNNYHYAMNALLLLLSEVDSEDRSLTDGPS